MTDDARREEWESPSQWWPPYDWPVDEGDECLEREYAEVGGPQHFDEEGGE